MRHRLRILAVRPPAGALRLLRYGLLLTALAPQVAFAKEPAASAPPPAASNDKVAAEALYEDAKRLINDGQYAAALEKLQASQRLDPALGTLLNIGFCLEKLNRTASAWATYNEVVGLARTSGDKQGRGDRAAEAARALEPKLSKVTLAVPREVRIDGLEIKRDGDKLDPGTWETAIPIDPGSHTFEAAAPGHVTWSSVLVVPSGPSAQTLTVPLLPAGASSPQRAAGLAVGGIGVASVIVGAVFGGLTLAKKSDETSHCEKANPSLCDATGVSLRSQALTFANVSNATFAIGGALVVTGLVVFLTAPKRDAASSAITVAPLVAAHEGGVWMGGRF